MEGRFLEMEAVTKDKESADAIINFRLGRRESNISSMSPPSPTFSNHSTSGSPPPYSPPNTALTHGTQVKLTELREEVNINVKDKVEGWRGGMFFFYLVHKLEVNDYCKKEKVSWNHAMPNKL